ncbi:hypothetical protein MOQ_009498 [Trypanosoma cruzi marinkellei]|uniref:RING-type domain-containing protein n=1 Tax=Trypanosoma cruzi marinkellei TaxID=85056 RepID=K2MWN0_TRYCR|nr:hypothetical protein MOQ_009498 [Trypanosoma cruzi marinkellei]
MLSEEDQLLFVAAKEAQLTRNEAVHIIMSDVPHSVFYGAFIRVLLELQDHREDYIVARVGAIATGEVYGGFSNNANIRTDNYLVLQLPPHLAKINGTQYQLNSISNSPMTEGEFSRWLEVARSGTHALSSVYGLEGVTPVALPVPTREELAAAAWRIRGVIGNLARHGHGVHRQRRPSQVQLSQAQEQGSATPPPENVLHPLSVFPSRHALPPEGNLSAPNPHSACAADNACNRDGVSNFARQITTASLGPANSHISQQQQQQHNPYNPLYLQQAGNINGNVEGSGPGEKPPIFHGATSPIPVSTSPPIALEISVAERELDLPTRRQIRQDIINKMNQNGVLFPTNINELKVSQLRLAERDMIEYLEQVREAISSKQENCVVCMDHVPTVISLPCRHKVLCRLCAPSVSTCPVCRSQLFELFEPKEI